MTVQIADHAKGELQKIQVIFLHPADLNESIKPLVKKETKLEALGLGATLSSGKRYFVNNNSLFALMAEGAPGLGKESSLHYPSPEDLVISHRRTRDLWRKLSQG